MTTLSFPDIRDVLPHRGSMLFQDEIKDFSAEQSTCAYRVPYDSWNADETHSMPAWFGIEVMAQAVAAHVALTAIFRGDQPKPGALLGSRDFRSKMAAFPPGSELLTTARREFIDDSGLGVYVCEIALAGQTIASATLKVYEPHDFNAFLANGTQAS